MKVLGYDNIGLITVRKFRQIMKGVITLGNTTKKTVVKHRQDGHYTVCGRYVGYAGTYTNIKTNKTWRGVTCKRCLAIKATRDRIASARKSVKTGRISVTV